MLPKEFQERMKKLLGEEADDFFQSYEKENDTSLRINPLKKNWENAAEMLPFHLTRVPWCEQGYYYEKEDAAGKHAYHNAGVYYIQEASAMSPVEYLDVEQAEKILDLCAAPGGKSTQIAGKMRGTGILFCNEIHPARAKILSENIERLGVRNAIVTNETPQRLAENFVEYFDRILVDAPCSGEGMFRKNEEAQKEWSPENVELCAKRQEEILDCAASMLARGGKIVYSTCTFAPEENEGSITEFLKRHPEFEIVKTEKKDGMSKGRADWFCGAPQEIEETIRLFPHKIRGEGHYLAVLKKAGEKTDGFARGGEAKGTPEKNCKEYLEFKNTYFKKSFAENTNGKYLFFGEQLYLTPEKTPSLNGLKVLRAGLHLGTVKKNRFEPSHALALALSNEDVCFCADFAADGQEIASYLKGETFSYDGEKGWYLITADGYSIGWGKLAGGVMKNHYPKGLRRQGV